MPHFREPAEKGQSLADFIKANSCPICTLPPEVRQEVEDGLEAGAGTQLIARWLTEAQGVRVNASSVQNHRDDRGGRHVRQAQP